MQPTTISEVIHPETGEIVGYEITSNVGKTYFMSRSKHYEDLRAGEFPNGNFGGRYGVPFTRKEIVRMETVDGF